MVIKDPIPLKFGPEEENIRLKYVYDMIDSLKRGMTDLLDNKIKDWRKLKNGQPDTDKKVFPWRGASNLVIQVVAMNIETLLAQVMASIYETMPIWTFALIGDFAETEYAEEQRNILEEFMNEMALEKKDLDLYRVESVLFEAAIGYGFNAGKMPFVMESDSFCIGVQDGIPAYTEIEKINGPRPEVIPFEDFMVPANTRDLDEAKFKCHIIHLKKYDLLERKFLGRYDADKVQKILASPDRGGPSTVERERQNQTGAKAVDGTMEEEWDLYECHYPYWVDVGGTKRKLSVIETYHYGTRTSMRAVHNWLPNNENIFFGARFGYTDRGIYELGYCEMLKHAQIEISNEHNRYADNGTLANTSMMRVDPDHLTKLDASFSVYPTAILPFPEGMIEIMNIGREQEIGVDRERQALDLVKMRTGLDNGFTAAGGGVVNPKRGIYSAMGTMAVLQAGNKKSNLRTNDFRRTHLEIGNKSLNQYANFGIGSKIKKYGEAAKYLRMALESVRNDRLAIPLRSANASINREVEKQNDMLMVNIMNQHYVRIAQILQSLPQSPEHMRDYLVNIIVASDFLMRHLLRNFGHDDVSRLLPEPKFITEIKEQQQNGKGTKSESGNVSEGSGGNVPTESLQQTNFQPQGTDFGSVQQQSEHISVPVS